MPTNVDPGDEEAPDGQGQPLIEHLIELRSRLLKCVGFVMVIFLPLFLFANDIYTYISAPLRAFLPTDATMIATEVASPFLTPFKLTLVLSIFAAIPFILHQVWAFIAPGLYSNEKKMAGP
ncbi:MAG: twin-arginine translocase subunit TatC, partial [Pseudomonadales bacterium]